MNRIIRKFQIASSHEIYGLPLHQCMQLCDFQLYEKPRSRFVFINITQIICRAYLEPTTIFIGNLSPNIISSGNPELQGYNK